MRARTLIALILALAAAPVAAQAQTPAAAFLAGGAAAVIKAACGGRGDGVTRAWELAMGAVHGPIGAHESQGQHPEVIKVKARCLADLRAYLAVYEGT